MFVKDGTMICTNNILTFLQHMRTVKDVKLDLLKNYFLCLKN